MIIGLSGYAQSGKDTVAGILVEHHGYRRVAFADKLRAVALAIDPIVDVDETRLILGDDQVRLSELVNRDGWDTAKTSQPEVRRTLQTLGTAIRDHIDPWAWIKAALNDVDVNENIVISDVRFRNEAEAITARGGTIIRIQRPNTHPVNGHVSEHDLDNWPYDHTINNDGTVDDLTHTVDLILGGTS